MIDKQKRIKLRSLVRSARAIVIREAREAGFITVDPPSGFCGDWSYVFYYLCKANRLKPTIISGRAEGEPHYWVEVSGYLCDGTADQFYGMPAITCHNLNDDRYEVEYEENVNDLEPNIDLDVLDRAIKRFLKK